MDGEIMEDPMEIPIKNGMIWGWYHYFRKPPYTLQEINISHLGKRKIIFKMDFSGDMLVPRRVLTITSRAARGGGGSFKNRKPIGKIRCCESRNVFVGGNSKTATAVKNLDAITECEAHDYCFANCFQTS